MARVASRAYTGGMTRPVRLAGATLLATLLGAALTGCPSPTPGPTTSPTPPSSPAASPTGGATGGPGGGSTALLAVYYTLTDMGTPKLVREFHRLPVGADTAAAKATAAVTEMLRASAQDPDYKTLWPSGASVRGVSVAGDVTTVDLAGVSTGNVGAIGEAQAVQQLVWTVTAATGKPLVQIKRDGKIIESLWGHVTVDKPLPRAAAADTIHAVWVIAPQHGDRTGADVTVHLAGIVFEATVNYDVLQNGKVVKHGVVTLGPGQPAQGETKLTVRLSPGTYVIEAYEVSAKDGSRLHIDNHTFTVT